MEKDNFKDHIYALIVAGGGGTRMWPKSREKTPKQFLKLFESKTLIEITAERLRKFLPWEKIFVITVSNDYKKEIQKYAPIIRDENIIVEPLRRDSAPAYTLGALYIYKKDPKAVIVNATADHLISPESKYVKAMMVASEAAYNGDYLVAVGVKPFYPHTGMGHIKRGERHEVINGSVVYKLETFIEKPEMSLAKRFTRSSKYYWNTAQYVWRADSLLHAVKKYAKDISYGMAKIEEAIGTSRENEVIMREYRRMPKISIDYAVSEKAKNFLLVIGRYNWTDIGDWNEVWKHLPKDYNGNVIIDGESPGGEVINIDTTDALIQTDGRLIAVVDMDNIVVIDTPDALLICPKSRAQSVKKIVNKLKEDNRKSLL